MKYLKSKKGYYYKQLKNGKKYRITKKEYEKHKIIQKGGGEMETVTYLPTGKKGQEYIVNVQTATCAVLYPGRQDTVLTYDKSDFKDIKQSKKDNKDNKDILIFENKDSNEYIYSKETLSRINPIDIDKVFLTLSQSEAVLYIVSRQLAFLKRLLDKKVVDEIIFSATVDTETEKFEQNAFDGWKYQSIQEWNYPKDHSKGRRNDYRNNISNQTNMCTDNAKIQFKQYEFKKFQYIFWRLCDLFVQSNKQKVKYGFLPLPMFFNIYLDNGKLNGKTLYIWGANIDNIDNRDNTGDSQADSTKTIINTELMLLEHYKMYPAGVKLHKCFYGIVSTAGYANNIKLYKCYNNLNQINNNWEHKDYVIIKDMK